MHGMERQPQRAQRLQRLQRLHLHARPREGEWVGGELRDDRGGRTAAEDYEGGGFTLATTRHTLLRGDAGGEGGGGGGGGAMNASH